MLATDRFRKKSSGVALKPCLTDSGREQLTRDLSQVWVPEIVAREFRKLWHVLLSPARPPLS